MKAQQTITYIYDPSVCSLAILINGKSKGSFSGAYAEQMFNQLLLTGVDIQITNMTSEAQKNALIRQFHAALSNRGMMKFKSDILERNGVDHTAELSNDQLKAEINLLNGTVKKVESPEEIRNREFVRAMRSDLLTMCNKMGIYVTNDDWSDVNHFFESPRVAGKRLNKLSLEELTALVPKMRAILAKHIKAQKEINRQKLMN